MSSREIADLLDCRHDNVKVTVERLVGRGVIVQPAMQDVPLTDSLGRPRVESVYLLEKRPSYIVVAQLSPEFTASLVDRWQELEELQAPAAPQVATTMAQALLGRKKPAGNSWKPLGTCPQTWGHVCAA